jgi:hypothetical protein
MDTDKQFMCTGKQLMGAGKLVKSRTSAGMLYVLILRLKDSMTVPANIFLEIKRCNYGTFNLFPILTEAKNRIFPCLVSLNPAVMQ